MKDETGDKASGRTMSGRWEYIRPIKEAVFCIAWLRKNVGFNWIAEMVRNGVDVEKALADLVIMSALWPPRRKPVFTLDSLMHRHVQDVAIFAANSLCRVCVWLRMGAPRDDLLIRRWCRREGQIARSCGVALKLRAGELIALCEHLRIHGCTEAFVQQHPFLIALAVKHQLHGGIDDED